MEFLKMTKKLIQEYPKFIFGYVFAALLMNIISFIVPILNGKIIDSISTSYNDLTSRAFLLVMGGALTLNIALTFLFKYIVAKKGTKVIFTYNLCNLNRLEHKIIEHATSNPSYLHNRISQDVDTTVNFVLTNIVGILVNIVLLLSVGILFLRLSATLLVAVIVYTLLFFAIYIFFRQRLYYTGRLALDAKNVFYSIENREFERIKEIKMHVDYDNSDKYLKRNFSDMYTKNLEATRASLQYETINQTLTIFFQITITMIGIQQISKGVMSLGTFTILSTYFYMFLDGIKYFFKFAQSYQTFKASYQRLEEIDNIPDDAIGDKEIDSVESLLAKDISYSFSGKTIYFKEDLTLGMRGLISIVGRNGSGKTLLSQILVNLYNYGRQGIVRINNIPISELNMNIVRKSHISYCFAEELFPDMTVEEFISKYKMRSAESLQELATTITEGEFDLVPLLSSSISNLSMGERKFLSILLTIDKEAKFYIFDEPLANLHQNVASWLTAYLKELSVNHLIIVIDHSREFDKIADQIVEL